MNQLLFASSSNYWFPGLPSLQPMPPPPNPVSEEVAAKASAEMPSTSSDNNNECKLDEKSKILGHVIK